uniref:Fe2OG dioxygenase domain-containing protein n=1 Tax=Kalanchoe fedtschenkoi TaxID=63787 RepID=A0A7N0UAN6_KALFE
MAETPRLRVQALSQIGISHVPPQFIQQPENRPVPPIKSLSTIDIPVIDLAGIDSDRSDEIRNEIGRVCEEWGAFQVINHGVPVRLLDDMRNVGLTFFHDLPMEEKLKYACDTSAAATEGYGTRMLAGAGDDAVLDWRDYFDHHTFPLSRRNPSRWPHFPPQYREVVAEYADQMKLLAHKLLASISQSLGLVASSIEHAVAHSDFGAITLLTQDDVEGLQVLKDGNWIIVKPLSHAIIVLLSDQTEIMTNGKYRSAIHRAIANSSKARLSVATFHDPAKPKIISPIADLISESCPPRYRAVLYSDYVSSWYTKGPEGKRNIDSLLL